MNLSKPVYMRRTTDGRIAAYFYSLLMNDIEIADNSFLCGIQHYQLPGESIDLFVITNDFLDDTGLVQDLQFHSTPLILMVDQVDLSHLNITGAIFLNEGKPIFKGDKLIVNMSEIAEELKQYL